MGNAFDGCASQYPFITIGWDRMGWLGVFSGISMYIYIQK
jgi:hypothetical protein